VRGDPVQADLLDELDRRGQARDPGDVRRPALQPARHGQVLQRAVGQPDAAAAARQERHQLGVDPPADVQDRTPVPGTPNIL
jgi:hypothetical protein